MSDQEYTTIATARPEKKIKTSHPRRHCWGVRCITDRDQVVSFDKKACDVTIKWHDVKEAERFDWRDLCPCTQFKIAVSLNETVDQCHERINTLTSRVFALEAQVTGSRINLDDATTELKTIKDARRKLSATLLADAATHVDLAAVEAALGVKIMAPPPPPVALTVCLHCQEEVETVKYPATESSQRTPRSDPPVVDLRSLPPSPEY